MTRPPAWLAETADRVALMFSSPDVLAPIGCHYYHDQSRAVWEVTLFVSSTETVGGEWDGKRTPSRFSVDVAGVQAVFSEIRQMSWQALSLGAGDDLGPHLSIEGRVGEHEVWLRIMAQPPEPFEAGRTANAYEGRLTDRW